MLSEFLKIYRLFYRGQVCGGPAVSNQTNQPSFQLSAVEQKVSAHERQLHLTGVRFDVYEGAIKRYGYVGRVRDESLKEISNDINLDAK